LDCSAIEEEEEVGGGGEIGGGGEVEGGGEGEEVEGVGGGGRGEGGGYNDPLVACFCVGITTLLPLASDCSYPQSFTSKEGRGLKVARRVIRLTCMILHTSTTVVCFTALCKIVINIIKTASFLTGNIFIVLLDTCKLCTYFDNNVIKW